VTAAAIAAQALGGVAVRVQLHPYATSHELMDVDVELPDATVVRCVVKETCRLPLRPAFVQRPEREARVYGLLQPPGVWAPTPLATSPTHLVLERVDGQPLWELETHDVADRVGAVLRAVHDALAREADAPFLLRYDRRYYDRWFRRACAGSPALGVLRDAHDAATTRLLAEPAIVLHGELYPANVLVRAGEVLFVDWECAAAGPAVVDLAAVTTGWDAASLEACLAAYGRIDRYALDCARFHLALRWLGWSAAWRPPEEHARDWQREAELAASRIETRRAA